MKYYLNGFPKSGLHLLDQLCKPLTLNIDALWAGTHAQNAFTMQRIGVEQVCNSISYTADNHRLKGHCCFDKDIEWFIALSGIVHIFIHRDLRDVAVSQAHHILDDNDILQHPDKEHYRKMGSFDAALKAVWYGDDKFSGVPERWAEYEPWLTSNGTLVLSFEDTIADLHTAADKILDFTKKTVPALAGQHLGRGVQLTASGVVTNADEMVASALDTGASITFRKGKAGGWKKYAHLIPEWDYE